MLFSPPKSKGVSILSRNHSTTHRRKFNRLTPFQRGKIAALLNANVPKTKIAKYLGIARSTLYREIIRGTTTQMRSDLTTFTKYFPETGQLTYEKHRKNCHKPYLLAKAQEFIEYLEQKILNDKLSPDSICGRTSLEGRFPIILSTKQYIITSI